MLAAAADLAPRVLGQLLDAAAVAQRAQRTVHLSKVPRMVGPTKWIEAAAEVLGLEFGKFLEAYLESQERAAEMALDANLIGMPLVDMLAGRAALAALGETTGEPYVGPVGFEGTAADLLKQLNEFMQGKLASGTPLAADAQGHGRGIASARPSLAQTRLRCRVLASPKHGGADHQDRHPKTEVRRHIL